MSKFKKIDKEFLVTNSTLNCYKYRLLTAGYQQAEYERNPIGYRMHNRDNGVVVKWVDFGRDGDNVYAKPVVNLSHPEGQRIVDEIENGFLNAASMGMIVALEISQDPKDYLPDQTGPTVSKWFNRELSLVDVPGNYDALTNLVDSNGRLIDLSAFNTKNFTMKINPVSAAVLAFLPNLSADSTQEQFDAAIKDLAAKAAKADILQTQLTAEQAAKLLVETELNNLKASSVTETVTALLATGRAEKKLTVEMSNALAISHKDNPTGLKALLAIMQPIASIVAAIDPGKSAVPHLAAKTWSELDKAGQLQELRTADEPSFFDKFKAEFGVKHNDDKR